MRLIWALALAMGLAWPALAQIVFGTGAGGVAVVITPCTTNMVMDYSVACNFITLGNIGP